MEAPKWAEYMLPVLDFLKDGIEHKRIDIINNVSKKMELSDEIKDIRINSGELQWLNRVSWALSYLKQSGLIESPRRSYFIISKDGKELLDTKPERLVEKDLEKYPKYIEFCERSIKTTKSSKESEIESTSLLTPEDMIDEATDKIKSQVCHDLLEKVMKMDPTSFEKLVISLIKKLGYGYDDSCGIHTGKTGDGGIDGIINQDKLGLDTIYIQAKRYKEGNKVSSHEVRDFIGALQVNGRYTEKGIFITASDFTSDAVKTAEKYTSGKIVLINGIQLAGLMYDNEVGVTVDKIIKTNKIDEDFFEE